MKVSFNYVYNNLRDYINIYIYIISSFVIYRLNKMLTKESRHFFLNQKFNLSLLLLLRLLLLKIEEEQEEKSFLDKILDFYYL